MMLQSLMVITEPLTLDRHDEPGEDMMQRTAPSKHAHHICWHVSQSGTVGGNRTAGHWTVHCTCKSGPAHHALRIACTLDLDLSTLCVCMHWHMDSGGKGKWHVSTEGSTRLETDPLHSPQVRQRSLIQICPQTPSHMSRSGRCGTQSRAGGNT